VATSASISTPVFPMLFTVAVMPMESLPERSNLISTSLIRIGWDIGWLRPTYCCAAVTRWRNRYETTGITGLIKDRSRLGRKKRIGENKVREVVEKTLQEKPLQATHWSTRSLAAAVSLSPATIRRIWRAHGLKPLLVRSFKLSRDPRFIEKLHDVAGLYLNPPEHALVFSVDEKSQRSGIKAKRFLQIGDTDKIVIEEHFARFYGLKPGERQNIGNVTFAIVGIVAAQSQSQVSAINIYMDLVDAQQLLGTDGYSQLYMKIDNLSSEDAITSAISRADSSAVVVSGNSIATSLSNAVKIYDRFHILGSAILTFTATLILIQINAAGLIERRKEIGVMQTVEWTKKNIGQQIILEIFLQAVLGCVLAVGISITAVIPPLR